MVGAAFNPMANMYVPDFIKQFQPNFPIGSVSRETTLEYLQHSPIMNFYVPIVVFIDRQGIIRDVRVGAFTDAMLDDRLTKLLGQ